jgi:uncharacterized membrane protein AbrB (regulator of aidB expression)
MNADWEITSAIAASISGLIVRYCAWLTAYLATSPGGMDSVAIIAAAAQHVAFVMALQSARFLVVLLVGPSVARLVARSLRE